MRITTLIENRPCETDDRLQSEWGLSLHISFNGRNLLFDTGSTGAFAKNAELLSIDLAAVETAILSHHHNDHGGGLMRFFEANPIAKVHLGQLPRGECILRPLPLIKKYVGLDNAFMASFANRFNTVTEPAEILPDVFVFPHISGSFPKPAGNKRIFVRRDGKLVLDDFNHEIVMAIKENNKLVIFTGCSHNGILNMVDTVARELTGIPVKAVIGGFHLIASPPFNFIAGGKRGVEDLSKSILDYPIDQAFTGHCTGTKAFAILKNVMGEHLTDMRTGSCFEV